ncbi:MAG: ABC transporter ATP-binding protein [Chitinophagales bacterium]
MSELLAVRDLKTHFPRPEGVVKAVDGISYSLGTGGSLGIVGESGSGKSVSVLSLIGLIRKPGRVVGGEAIFGGRDLLKLSREEMRRVRGKEIGVVFQDPMTSLNPTLTIGQQLMEPFLWHGVCDRREAKRAAIELLDQVGIPSPAQRVGEYPFQFSGGMKQRVMIAMAIACRPKLLIADEPTTALDVTVQAQILDLIRRIKDEYGTSVITITHDFGVAAQFCDRVMVMYAGRVVETAAMAEFLARPLHPYSRGLLNSTVDIDEERERIEPIPGAPPNLMDPPSGCRFHPRCTLATPECSRREQVLAEHLPDHAVACWRVQEGEISA